MPIHVQYIKYETYKKMLAQNIAIWSAVLSSKYEEFHGAHE